MKTLFLSTLLLGSIDLYSQNSFNKGYFVTLNRDTINCWLPITSSYNKKIIFKKNKNGVEEYIDTQNISCVNNGYTIYERIVFQDGKVEGQLLLRLMIEGSITLYMSIEMPEFNPSYAYTCSSFNSMKKNYVIKRNGQSILVPKKKFIKFLYPYLEDIPEISGKLGKKNYKYDDLLNIVDEYNKSLLSYKLLKSK
jgi:hypothetical protein